MNAQTLKHCLHYCWVALMLAAWPAVGNTQVSVAQIEEVEELPTLTSQELEELIGPIALYPDDLLAIVLPASTFPLQIVEAGRFLEDLETDPSLKPDEDWDDSVVALTNYPEVVELLNEDLDWTWRLGEAVVAQQADVIAAVELFRDRAYAAGNLKSDDYQTVANEGGTIQITPVEEDVIYVPYYEPERVVVYQPRPVYYYYPRAYPVYYYPYPSYYSFHDSFFWGVTTAFAIGWHSHHLNVYHHSYYGHPYYGHSYYNRYWYRRPDIHHYNNVYVRNNHISYTRYRDGDRWAPNVRRTVRSSDQRVTRTRYYPNSDSRQSQNTHSFTNTSSSSSGRTVRSSNLRRELDGESNRAVRNETRPEIRFRERSNTTAANRTSTTRLSKQPGKDQARQEPSRQTLVRQSDTRKQLQSRTSRTSRQEAAREFETGRKPQGSHSGGSRQPQVRQSQPRQQPQVRQSQPRQQPQVRQSQPRQQPQVRQSQVRQSQVRQSQPRQKPQVRQSQPKMSAPRQSQPKQSRSESSQSRKSTSVARNSNSRSSSRRDRH
jgi:hypothetical protein